MIKKINQIAVFCGANMGYRTQYKQATQELGQVLVKNKITLIYGGGKVGLMGILADRVLELGGKVIGVIPQSLVEKELAHTGVTQLHIVDSMHERKLLMMQLAQGFIMLPGGAGSLDEFFEAVTLRQLGEHNKPLGILNVDHYFDALIDYLKQATVEGFLPENHYEMINLASDATDLINKLFKASQVIMPRWQNKQA